MKSRYDDPEYQKQVALQMLGTPTLEIACRAITDQRAQIKQDAIYVNDLLQRIKDLEHLYDVAHGANSPESHFNYFMQELGKRFPDTKNHVRNKALVDLYLQEIDQARDAQAELLQAKRQLLNVFTGGKLFPGERA